MFSGQAYVCEGHRGGATGYWPSRLKRGSAQLFHEAPGCPHQTPNRATSGSLHFHDAQITIMEYDRFLPVLLIEIQHSRGKNKHHNCFCSMAFHKLPIPVGKIFLTLTISYYFFSSLSHSLYSDNWRLPCDHVRGDISQQKSLGFCVTKVYTRGPQTFSAKGQMVNISGHGVSVGTTQLCHGSKKSSQR